MFSSFNFTAVDLYCAYNVILITVSGPNVYFDKVIHVWRDCSTICDRPNIYERCQTSCPGKREGRERKRERQRERERGTLQTYTR